MGFELDLLQNRLVHIMRAMSHTSKAVIGVIAVLAGFVVGGYVVQSFMFPNTYVPEEFSTARINGAQYAGRIMELSNASIKNIARVATLEESGDFAGAEAVIQGEVDAN